MNGTRSPRVLYSVWNNKTGECVAAYETGEECARRTGMTLPSFRSAVTRTNGRSGVVNGKWCIKSYNKKKIEAILDSDGYDDIEEMEVW